MGLRYEFDKLHRLVILDALDAVQPRRVVEGRVSVDPKNRLVYRARTAPARAGGHAPLDYVFDGTWRLTPDQQLAFALHHSEDTRRQNDRTPYRVPGQREQLFLKAAVVGAAGHSLSAVLDHGQGPSAASQRISLAGRWQADAQNRLTFQVEKANGRTDELVFDSAWELGPRSEIRYHARRPARGVAVHAVRLAGSWGVTPDSQLVYRLEGTTRSTLAFQASLQSRTLQAREGRLAYQLGIRLSGGRTVTRHITLFGAWKLHRNLSVSFELPGSRRQAATFQGTATFFSRNRLTVALSDRRGEPLKAAVTFSRAWMEDAEWFVRAQSQGREAQVLGGVRITF